MNCSFYSIMNLSVLMLLIKVNKQRRGEERRGQVMDPKKAASEKVSEQVSLKRNQ